MSWKWDTVQQMLEAEPVEPFELETDSLPEEGPPIWVWLPSAQRVVH